MADSQHHNQQHDHGHKHQHGHEHSGRPARGLHKDWRVWVAVILALAAMAAYLASMDESIRPGVPAGQPMPAAPAP